MRLGVVGSRGLVRTDLLERKLDSILAVGPLEGVVSGGARGTDQAAERWALENGLWVISYRPSQLGQRWVVVRHVFLNNQVDTDELPEVYTNFAAAAFSRNGFIVDVSDQVLAAWDGHSTGTKDSIRKAEAAGKLLELVRF